MAKYISSIKDLVIKAMTNVFAINEKAKSNDAEACFQMGMIYLLGINVPINFKKVKQCLENDSLKDSSEAFLLLGLVAELEGDYSLAFKNYFNAARLDGDSSEKQYICNAAKGRESLKNYLKTLGLSTHALSNTISKILEVYSKSKTLESSVEIAMICKDEATCAEAIQNLCEAGDDSSAKKMLQLCHIDLSKSIHIRKMLFEKQEKIELSNSIQVIDVEGNSFLTGTNLASYFDKVSNVFDILASQCCQIWVKKVIKKIEKEEMYVKKQWKEEKEIKERIRKRKEEEKRQALLQQQAEEEERARKRKKIITIIIAILCCLIFGVPGIIIVLLYFWYAYRKNKKIEKGEN